VSVVAAVARVGEIEAMIASSTGAQQPAAATSTNFQQQLMQASAGGPGLGTMIGTAGATATAATGATGSGGDGPYKAEIDAAAAKYGLDPALLRGLIRQESNFDPNAGSPAGAQGLCQLMPGTAAALGCTNVHDPAQNIDAGARYLRQQLDAFGGDVAKALAAYNAGPGAVQRYGGVPPYAETQNYVRQVQAYAAQYRSQSQSQPQSLPQPQPAAAIGTAGSLPYSTV
jgi:soluble lytic murein transglycosylase-like protein